MRAERSHAGSAGRNYPSPRTGSGASRGGAADRIERDPSAAAPRLSPRVTEGRGPDRASRPAPAAGYRDAPPAARREAAGSGPGLRGAFVVLGMFAVTLVAAAADSYIGVGLGTITLIALLLAAVFGALRVRRRDLLSVVVAPPLVFVAVALLNIALAPSASFSLPTLATLLIRGFPAMGLATAAALLIALGRLITRR